MFLDAQASLAPTPVSPLVHPSMILLDFHSSQRLWDLRKRRDDIVVVDMVVDIVADMEVDMMA